MELQEKVEIVENDEELDKMDALNEENRQGNIVKEALEKEEEAIAWDKVKKFMSSPWFLIFCILFIVFIYFFVNI